jgi:hypothetical protein
MREGHCGCPRPVYGIGVPPDLDGGPHAADPRA